jgi:hypothetical protein
MIRFLPEKNKKEIKIEYFSRVFSVVLIFMILLGIISTFSIFPAYIISFYRDISIKSQSASVEANKIDTNEQESLVKTTNELILFLNQFKNEKPSVQMLGVLEKTNKNIKINQISYSKRDSLYQFIFKGVADNREGLLSFVKDIKLDKNISAVDLPVSDFVKSSDIDFTITLSIK